MTITIQQTFCRFLKFIYLKNRNRLFYDTILFKFLCGDHGLVKKRCFLFITIRENLLNIVLKLQIHFKIFTYYNIFYITT